MNSYLIRDACASDIDDIFELSKLLNTINLPANKPELEQVIVNSEASFSLQENDIKQRSFLFVLTNNNRVIGTSQIFAKHGTLSSPHLYFQVEHDERYSETLKKFFRHKTLRLCQSFDGPTEIGSLVLDTNYRNTPEKLGTFLSYVRFLFIAMKPHYFSHTVLAELLPPLGSQFESALWNAVGHKFTGLSYYEADMISRTNKEFIKTLFPSGEMYVTLLPESAQEVIGQVGKNSKGAAYLLSKIGFRYSHRVDPFDGGPHFEAEQDEISLLKEALKGRIQADENTVKDSLGIVGRFSPKHESGNRFKALVSPCRSDGGEIYAPSSVLLALGMASNEEVTVIKIK